MTWRLDRADCLEWLREIQDETVHLVLTDPPYESLERHRRIGTTTRLRTSDASSNRWFPTIPNSLYPELAREFRRVLTPTGAVMLFGDDETTLDVAVPAMLGAGFRAAGTGSTTYRRVIVWDKGTIGTGYHVRRRHELVLYWRRGVRSPSTLPDYDGGFGSVQQFPRVSGGYPTEKPVPLLRALIRQSTAPGELVVDPFAGSGSTGEAALLEGRVFAGCDIGVAEDGGPSGTVDDARRRLAALGPEGDPLVSRAQMGLRIS